MARGNSIVVTPEPKGVFTQGYIGAGLTPKPGVAMQIQVATAERGGRFTYELWAPGTDGNRRQMIILLEDRLQGKTAVDAYAAGDFALFYTPLPGEEMNVLFGNASGTADDIAVGDLLICDEGTGKFVETTGSPESEPFQALEAIVDPVADQLIHVVTTGH